MDVDAEKCTLTVVGTVDPVCIAQKLKKKCFAVNIISVEDDKPKPPGPGEDEGPLQGSVREEVRQDHLLQGVQGQVQGDVREAVQGVARERRLLLLLHALRRAQLPLQRVQRWQLALALRLLGRQVDRRDWRSERRRHRL